MESDPALELETLQRLSDDARRASYQMAPWARPAMAITQLGVFGALALTNTRVSLWVIGLLWAGLAVLAVIARDRRRARAVKRDAPFWIALVGVLTATLIIWLPLWSISPRAAVLALAVARAGGWIARRRREAAA